MHSALHLYWAETNLDRAKHQQQQKKKKKGDKGEGCFSDVVT